MPSRSPTTCPTRPDRVSTLRTAVDFRCQLWPGSLDRAWIGPRHVASRSPGRHPRGPDPGGAGYPKAPTLPPAVTANDIARDTANGIAT
ncbi:hypothetical protein BCD48_34860 [Pseudofrankia sp. BMG5.36]|nr:hypothetical protein BCD48_34860 [Pseudofrankia sp. BMG5.36]